jgi:hypothetical protein
MQEMVGILPAGVEADNEVHVAVTRDDLLEALAQLRVTGSRLDERQFGGSGLKVVAQEGGVVPVARGVDADADSCLRGGGRL